MLEFNRCNPNYPLGWENSHGERKHTLGMTEQIAVRSQNGVQYPKLARHSGPVNKLGTGSVPDTHRLSTETGSDQRIQRSFHFRSIRPANKRAHQNAALRRQTHSKENPWFSPWLVEACSQGRHSPCKDPVCEHAPTSCLSAWHQSAPMKKSTGRV